jgi:mannitol-1-/sugar-/sorbitol-6-/2-deoxyglucose-6-phosphatase
MIRAVIFDMDGLLIDTEPKWQELEREFARKYSLEVTPEMQKQTLGLRTNEMIRYWQQYIKGTVIDPAEQEREIDEYMRRYYISEARIMKGSRETVDFFRGKGIKTALASSSPMLLIDTFIDTFGFKECFDVCHSAESEEFGKPHPGVYLTTARKLNVPPAQCLAFEDSFNGLRSAKSAGMKAVAVPDEYHFSDEHYAIADLKIRNLGLFGEKEFELLNNSL